MKLLAASVFAIGLSLAAMTASKAMPVAPLDQSEQADIIRVAGGCGWGWHRVRWWDRWGRWHWERCVPNWR